MKKILICCLFGNTATALAKKMQHVADERGYPLVVSAVGLDNFASVAPAFDGFLVAPHIQYKLDELLQEIGKEQPIVIIESYPYASLDGETVLMYALEHMPELGIN
ncbi:PTS cellobiose transporter subunit IIB [Enterobacter sp. RHBSTW-00994]|jgi:PTS system cellobiose-specific IIB component|uniref:PTS sugar transporter subunit IIB n=1 Tax=Enterobacteriaceae TaxID=543 RepID=UPI0015E9F9C5|nr:MULTISPECIES: PTS cellobiose transporter subunit IIB [Enterobacteriaceae]MBM3071908.1 PTS cellobiose transporter subunit IIB [Lelliottia sp. RWM.1]QLR43449.1 PTS cellobiose transporter subunit IIB [Enterobacter sp. RHBSTW-00994]